jgi:hypothetical protein
MLNCKTNPFDDDFRITDENSKNTEPGSSDHKNEDAFSLSSPLMVQKNVSRINNMTVGDVRQCFQQMRNTPDLKSSTVLWCGVTAGQFALAYLLQTTNSTSRRRRNKANNS